jgi:HrpA-like RNA helicase
MSTVPRWLPAYAGDDSDASDPSSPHSDSDPDSAEFDSSDEEMMSHRMRQGGVFGVLPATAQKLPAALRIPEIQSAIDKNRVVCILGNTGCGKSTIVPFILGQGDNVRILCTQPRRMAAISLCEHLQTKFFGQRNHQAVGYRVRGLKTDVETSKIVYVTAGYLKTMLTHNPGELSSFTHLVLDEVHERGIDSDFLSLIVKRLFLLPENDGVKLIVMSATLESELFVDYFASLNRGLRPATVRLTDARGSKSLHKIEEFFVNDIPNGESVVRLFDSQVMPRTDLSHGVVCGDLSEPVQHTIIDIVMHNSKDGRASLVFLPGLGEIYAVHDKLVDALYRAGLAVVTDGQEPPTAGSYYHLFVLHSSMPYEEQKLALQAPALRARHVVLCTNVAESSLTVPNVDVVIDSGLRKANSYDARTGIFRLTSVWCSKASCLQRRGRTGRVCDGKYFKLFTRSFFEQKMLSYDTPEVLLTDLSCVFLNAKYICEFWRQPDGGSLVVRPSQILNELITPPRVQSVKAAVEDLFEAGILRHEPNEMSELSLLGALATRLHVEPQIARLIFFGWLSGLCCEGLILAAACSMDADVIRSTSARSYVGKDDYCKNVYDFMWYRTGYDLGSLSEPITARNLLWAWMSSHYGVKGGPAEAPEYFTKATYAKEFDSFKRSVVNLASQFISWMQEEVGDELAMQEAETLRELVTGRTRSVSPGMVRRTVFKCGRNFEKLKSLLVIASNTRLLTADMTGGDFDESHALKLEKVSETLFLDCHDRSVRIAEAVCKLTGRTVKEVEQIERGSLAMNTSWVVVPGKDYPLHEVGTAPAADFNRVREDFHLLPHRESEFFGMIMPISVRTCMQIFDRRYQVGLEFVPSGMDYPVKAKLKVPQYSNAVKWGRIHKRDGNVSWLPITVNAKSPVGWLHRLPRENAAMIDRVWGVAGKIVGTTKSMFEDQLPLEARASNVTILPVAKGGRVALAMLLAGLPMHAGGLVAEVAISDSGEYEIVAVRMEGRFFVLNRGKQFPLTAQILNCISIVRRLVAKALDLPGSKKTEAGSLCIAPEVLLRAQQLQHGSHEECSLGDALDAMLDVVFDDSDTSEHLFGDREPTMRKVMLVPDSGCSYTEIITDPMLWVPPSMGGCSFAKRMLFRKDQIAEIQEKGVVVKTIVSQRDQQEAPIVRFSALGFSVDEIHRYLERQPRFFFAGMSLETIMEDEIDEECLLASTLGWADTEPSRMEEEEEELQTSFQYLQPDSFEPTNALQQQDMDIFTPDEEVLLSPVPVKEPEPKLYEDLPYRRPVEEAPHVSYHRSPEINRMTQIREPSSICMIQRSAEGKPVTGHEPLMRLWNEIVDENLNPYFSLETPQERLAALWQKVTKHSNSHTAF